MQALQKHWNRVVSYLSLFGFLCEISEFRPGSIESLRGTITLHFLLEQVSTLRFWETCWCSFPMLWSCCSSLLELSTFVDSKSTFFIILVIIIVKILFKEALLGENQLSLVSWDGLLWFFIDCWIGIKVWHASCLRPYHRKVLFVYICEIIELGFFRQCSHQSGILNRSFVGRLSEKFRVNFRNVINFCNTWYERWRQLFHIQFFPVYIAKEGVVFDLLYSTSHTANSLARALH